jgi:hypothetical protein
MGGCIFVKIGDYVWVEAQRYNDGFEKYYVVGETSRSWLINENRNAGADHWGRVKLSKTLPSRVRVGHQGNWHTVLYSDVALREYEWTKKHRYHVGRVVEGITDYTTLKVIAEIAGYDDTKLGS